MTEPAMPGQDYRDQMCMLMFEKFGVRRYCCANQQILALFASGRVSGIVVDCGHERTDIVPIYEGYGGINGVQHTCNIRMGGDLRTRFLVQQSLRIPSPSSVHLEIGHKMKEELCYVAQDFDAESVSEKEFVMPDGALVTIRDEMIRCPEVLFDPSWAGNMDVEGLHCLVHKCINNTSFDIRGELANNIVMAGGSCMFPGMTERLQAEIQGLCREPVRVISKLPDNDDCTPLLAPWVGASALSSLSTSSSIWARKDSNCEAFPPVEGYEDVGPRIVLQQCDALGVL